MKKGHTKKMKIALLAGGWSGEREVSLKSGEAVYNALDKRKYDVITYDPSIELSILMEAKEEIDLAFNLLHGKYGEDGCVQGLLDILGIRFLGSGILSSAMAMNKKVAKDIYRNEGLRVAKEVVMRKGNDFSVDEIETDEMPLKLCRVRQAAYVALTACSGAIRLPVTGCRPATSTA